MQVVWKCMDQVTLTRASVGCPPNVMQIPETVDTPDTRHCRYVDTRY